jgi:hypothetical protein
MPISTDNAPNPSNVVRERPTNAAFPRRPPVRAK